MAVCRLVLKLSVLYALPSDVLICGYQAPLIEPPEIACEDIDEYVLESLLDEGKYCKIVKKEGNEFFLLCNERPFYVKYDEKLDVGNNGWSFLEKNQELWNDLSDCDFYKSVKVKEDEYNLVFYYPIFRKTTVVEESTLRT